MAEQADASPGSGEAEGREPSGIRPEEEPGTGTLFIMLVFLMALAAVFMVAPGVDSDIYALVMATPVLIHQVWSWRQRREAVPEVA